MLLVASSGFYERTITMGESGVLTRDLSAVTFTRCDKPGTISDADHVLQ